MQSVRTVLFGSVFLFWATTSWCAPTAEELSQLDKRLRNVFSDSSFPDRLLPGFERFQRLITEAESVAAGDVLLQAARTYVGLTNRVGLQAQQKMGADMEQSLRAVLVQTLKSWAKDSDFRIGLTFTYGGEYVGQMLSVLAESVPQQQPALLGLGKLLGTSHNRRTRSYTRRYAADASIETKDLDSANAVALVKDGWAAISTIKPAGDEGARRYNAMQLALSAMSEYGGLFYSKRGVLERESQEDLLRGTGVFNEILLGINRISTPADLEVFRSLVLSRNRDGEIELDSRWMDKMGQYATEAEVGTLRTTYKPNSSPIEDPKKEAAESTPPAKRNRLLSFVAHCLRWK